MSRGEETGMLCHANFTRTFGSNVSISHVKLFNVKQ